MKKYFHIKGLLFKLMLATTLLFSVSTSCKRETTYSAYLFAYFTGNAPGEESIHFALSDDGLNYRALNYNLPVIDNKDISKTGGVRDPHILRGHDGKTYYMVATDLYTSKGWENTAMILLKSTDLIHWSSAIVDIPESFPEAFGDVYRVWAPQSIYDEATQKYMVYFSMKQGDQPDIIYYAYANADFTALETEPKQLYFNPTNDACIDADIIQNDGLFYMYHKSETGDPGIKLAISDQLTEGYKLVSKERVDKEKNRVEGSGVFKSNDSDEWILMYDVYTLGQYQFTKSRDLRNFEIVDDEVSMNFHPRHGTVLPITKEECKRLMDQWGKADDPLIRAKAKELHQRNVAIDGEKHRIHLPVKSDSYLEYFDPQFSAIEGTEISPKGPQDFSQGPVNYTVTIEGKGSYTYEVSAYADANPVLDGYYADPDILYAEKTGKYYIYPTTDGFYKWGGYYFKTFSSSDLLNWKDEGTILNLRGDVSWANRNAWAPCIIEKKINGNYKYFFYFTAEQKIGVAVADDPTGPFIDSGEPLIDWKPEHINRGQEIDPDVFTDPQTGKSYLYWGNGYLAAAELNEDMLSIKRNTLTIMTPDGTYREGTYVIYREGTYYFLWSEGDTRSPDYKVRYASCDKPLGKLNIPKNNIVIQKDTLTGIYGTGHNAVIQKAGSDEWFIVYHRFTVPQGIKMGRMAGFHREVCIDSLHFDPQGNIVEVHPTLNGLN